MTAYTSFKQWKNSGFLEHGSPRKQEYTKEELVWKYGYDAALMQVTQSVGELLMENQK